MKRPILPERTSAPPRVALVALVVVLGGCGRDLYDLVGPDVGTDASDLDARDLDADLDAAELDAPSTDAPSDAPDGAIAFPRACPTTGTFVCESFDMAPGDSGLWRSFAPPEVGFVRLNDPEAYSSPASLGLRVATGQNGRLMHTFEPAATDALRTTGLWARSVVRIVERPSTGVLVVFEIGSDMSNVVKVSFDIGPSSESVFVSGAESPTVDFDPARWTCLELFVRDSPAPLSDEVRFYADGVSLHEQVDFDLDPMDVGLVLTRLLVGPTTAAGADVGSMQLDDIYLGTERGGCR